ncbi:MAG: acyltransferase family protein [Actinobacteria bacterium]|nr:acyltransferase family protein [Actinomycetota bacterium]
MSRSTIAYQPALDGVRALAVSAVLLFHGGLSWMSGGYLGVSVFFTLSGFLITSLLLREHQSTGAIDAKAFFTRRARRLLPASLVCLAAVCVLAAAGAFDGLEKLRRDVLGALFQVFNWVKLASGESYADLTAAEAGLRRPLDHYWSLAIEEQFYWCWPLAFLGILWWCRRRGTSPLRVVAVLVALFTVSAPVIAQVWGPDAAYWATPARVAEILFGALVACVVAVRPVGARAAWWAPAALVALTVACVLFPDGSGPAYEGALPLIGALSALLVYGLQAPSAVRRVLSVRPLVALGKVSYGVYLYHWPVYVLVDRQAWDMPVAADLAVKWAITGALAVVSYWAIERPVRRSTWLVPRRTLVAAIAGTAVVVGLVFVVPATAKFYGIDSESADAAAIDTGSVAPLVPLTTVPPSSAPSTTGSAATESAPTSTVPASTTTTAIVPPRPVRIAVVGDSVAEATGAGVVAWAAANPQLAQVELVTGVGCGLVLDGYQDLSFGLRDVTETCGPYVSELMPDRVAELQPDLVMIVTSVWDAHDRSLVAGGPQLSPTDPELETVMATSLGALTDGLLARGVPRIAWVNGPVPTPSPLAPEDAQSEPERYAVLHRIIDEIAADRPGQVSVIDLEGWLEGSPMLDDPAVRPDHVHFTTEAATIIANEFLGQALLRAALT